MSSMCRSNITCASLHNVGVSYELGCWSIAVLMCTPTGAERLGSTTGRDGISSEHDVNRDRGRDAGRSGGGGGGRPDFNDRGRQNDRSGGRGQRESSAERRAKIASWNKVSARELGGAAHACLTLGATKRWGAGCCNRCQVVRLASDAAHILYAKLHPMPGPLR